MGKHIIYRAGKKALSKIRDNGLHPENIKVIAGAAGGPKWLILGHLDRFLFTAILMLPIHGQYLNMSKMFLGPWKVFLGCLRVVVCFSSRLHRYTVLHMVLI